MNYPLLIQYILLGIVLIGVAIYIISSLRKYRNSSTYFNSCSGCKLKEACGASKESKSVKKCDKDLEE